MQEPVGTHLSNELFLSCRICRASVRSRQPSAGEVLLCGRCSQVLLRGSQITSLQPAIALSFTGLILTALANVFPILTFEVAGNMQENLIITGVVQLWRQGYEPIAALVFFSAISAPALYFASILYVSTSCALKKRFPGVRMAAETVEFINAWNLVPVFAIACIAAVVKLRLLGSVHWCPGMLWIVLLSVCSVALAHVFDKDLVDSRLEKLPRL